MSLKPVFFLKYHHIFNYHSFNKYAQAVSTGAAMRRIIMQWVCSHRDVIEIKIEDRFADKR